MSNLASSTDNHPAAALRHFHDAGILQSAQCKENALCHYAFSVECAQKALLCWSTGKSIEDMQSSAKMAGHGISDIWDKVRSYIKAQASVDGSLASALPDLTLPSVLYNQHPVRRYCKNYPISDENLKECRFFAQEMERTLISMIIDGIISV